jgi:Cof subfamily protein (haloacid dehalogenase superfamily)
MQNDHQSATKFPYRLAAIDLDGTLLGPGKAISDQNAAAVRRLNENGAQVIIASGRRHQNSIRFQRQLQLTGPIIACQGGLIRDGESGNVIEAHFLPQTVAREIVDAAEKNGVEAIYYHLDHLYVPERNSHWINLYESRVGERAETLPSLSQLDGRRALKIVWYGDPVVLKKIRPEIDARYHGKVDVLYTESENLEFMPGGINAAALERSRASLAYHASRYWHSATVKTISRCWNGLVWGSQCDTGILQQSPRPEWSALPVRRRPRLPARWIYCSKTHRRATRHFDSAERGAIFPML